MPVQTISPKELHEQCQICEVDLIDVRTPSEFQEIHLKVAKSVPLEKLDPKEFMAQRNSGLDRPLFVICASGTRGRQACEKFHAAGFTNVINIEGGTKACVDAGLPVNRGVRKVIPLDRQMRIVMGTLVLLGVALGFLVHPVGFGLGAFVGCGLIFAGITDICPLSMLVAKMPWNQRNGGCCG